MGLVYANIELINGEDLVLARRGIISADDIKRMQIEALVDTGAYMLAINETIQQQLKLPVVERRKAQLANGHVVEYDVVAPVEIRFR